MVNDVNQDSQLHSRNRHINPKHHFTLIAMILLLCHSLSVSALARDNAFEQVKKLEKEYSAERAETTIDQLLQLGDELRDEKKYKQALEAYEEVFTIDPGNVRASAKIDVVRQVMQREGKDETGIVKGVYEEEAKNKVISYWTEIRDYLKEEKYGQARFTLEKLLLLDPFNQEAIQLHETLSKRFRENDEAGEAL